MTKESFEGWLTYQVTQEVRALGEKRIKEYEDMLVELAGGCNDMDKLALQAARLAGMIAGANTILAIEWEDFVHD